MRKANKDNIKLCALDCPYLVDDKTKGVCNCYWEDFNLRKTSDTEFYRSQSCVDNPLEGEPRIKKFSVIFIENIMKLKSEK